MIVYINYTVSMNKDTETTTMWQRGTIRVSNRAVYNNNNNKNNNINNEINTNNDNNSLIN
jgi:hypothetical protein